VRKTVIISSAVLSLILGIAVVPAHAQQEQNNEKQDQTKQQQKAKEQAKPEQQHAQQQQDHSKQQQQHSQQDAQHQQNQSKQQQQAQQEQVQQQSQDKQHAQQQEQNKQQQQHAQQQNQYNQQQHAQQQQHPQQHTQEQQRVEQSTWQDHRAKSWQSDHRTWQQRGGYDGYRIPDDRYRGYFGPQHAFRINGRPFMVYGGYPRFQYEGYWITLLDPWPEYWASNWYDNDDVYVNYGNDGYYMYNRRYPGVGIAISISM
jgi:hypothetical protein